MTIYVKHNNEIKSAIHYVKHNGEIKIPTSGWAKTGGELKQIWPPVSADGTVCIFNQATLEAFRDRVNAGETSLNGTVIADFTLSGEWTPIANYDSETIFLQYTGTFDGGGHTITGLTANGSSEIYFGLFSYIGSGGIVKDLTLANTSISWRGYVGAIAGYNFGGTIENCSNNSGAVSGTYAGGIVGYNYFSTVKNNTNTGTVTGANITTLASVDDIDTLTDDTDSPDEFRAMGGIVGYNDGGSIKDNANEGEVSGGNYTGDIIGYDAPATAEESAESSSEADAASEADASNDSAAQISALNAKIDELTEALSKLQGKTQD